MRQDKTDRELIEEHREYFRFVHPDIRRMAIEEHLSKQNLADIAIQHLHAVLNKPSNHYERQQADTAAREWLKSIGSEPK